MNFIPPFEWKKCGRNDDVSIDNIIIHIQRRLGDYIGQVQQRSSVRKHALALAKSDEIRKIMPLFPLEDKKYRSMDLYEFVI
jgi:hypothetical protein